MNITFAKGFVKSLKKIYWYNTTIYRYYSFVRHDIWYFMGNIWRFRKSLWRHRWWDGDYTLLIMRDSLQQLADGMDKYSTEITESRQKKTYKIRRAIYLINNHLDDNYFEMAEAQLGQVNHRDIQLVQTGDGNYKMVDDSTDEEKEHFRLVSKLAQTIEKNEWNELWDIFRGQNRELFERKIKDIDKNDWDSIDAEWNKFFDGSDLRGWWN